MAINYSRPNEEFKQVLNSLSMRWTSHSAMFACFTRVSGAEIHEWVEITSSAMWVGGANAQSFAANPKMSCPDLFHTWSSNYVSFYIFLSVAKIDSNKSLDVSVAIFAAESSCWMCPICYLVTLNQADKHDILPLHQNIGITGDIGLCFLHKQESCMKRLKHFPNGSWFPSLSKPLTVNVKRLH